jgi:UDP-N-acetylmuramoylalanine--D-glutamate ligase
MSQYTDKTVLILGLERQEDLLLHLIYEGAVCTVRESDKGLVEQWKRAHPEQVGAVTWEVGDWGFRRLHKFHTVFRGPAYSIHEPALVHAVKKGVALTSATCYFFELCPARIVAVAGGLGKGTTAAIIASILRTAGAKHRVYCPVADGEGPFDVLKKLTHNDIIVLKLYQHELEGLQKSPTVSVLLNAESECPLEPLAAQGYIQALQAMVAYQEEGDRVIGFSGSAIVRDTLAKAPGRRYTFALSRPARQAGWVAEVHGEEIIYLQMDERLDSFGLRGRKLLGKHHLFNILAASVAAAACGIPSISIQEAVVQFSGLTHTLEYIGMFGGYYYYNDARATQIRAQLAAVQALAGRRLHLIAGGKKPSNLPDAVADILVQQCQTICLLPGSGLGQWRRHLGDALKRTGAECRILDRFQEPIMETVLSGIQPHLKPDDCILFAPGAPFDRPFTSNKQRGDAFEAAVVKRYNSGV